jgi:hypothetical protein
MWFNSAILPRAMAQAGSAEIVTPTQGEALFGVVTITGTAANPNFVRYKLEYAPEQDPNPVWTEVAEVTQQVSNGILASWDTTALAAGSYQLRLRVVLRDGTVLQDLVNGLIVNNSPPTSLPTQLPTASPVPPTPFPTLGPSPTPLIQQPPTNTPQLPTITPTAFTGGNLTNPAASTDIPSTESNTPFVVVYQAISQAFCNGSLCAVGGFVVLGLYSFLSARLRPLLRRATGRD